MPRGRLTKKKRLNTTGKEYTFKFHHDYEGRMTKANWPSGTKVVTEYSAQGYKHQDKVNFLNPEDADVDPAKFRYAYDGFGHLAAMEERKTDQLMTWERDVPNQLARVNYDSTLVNNYNIDYRGGFQGNDPGYLGNGWPHEKRIEPLNREDFFRYGYDDLGRANSMEFVAFSDPNGGDLERYTYDPAGNLAELYSSTTGLATYGTGGNFGQVSGANDNSRSWEQSTSRLFQEELSDGNDEYATRNFSYDAGGRLVAIHEEVTGTDTELYYDVDDQAVVELRDGVYIERFDGMRAEQGGDTIENVLPNVRVVTDVTGLQTFKVVMNDLDGHAVFVFDAYGDEERREVTGIYGAVVEHPSDDPDTWNGGALWAVDGLHGSDEDGLNEVTHFGARHVSSRDGIWMQPEPYLARGPFRADLTSPGAAFGSQYAGGNPIALQDTSGEAAVSAPAAALPVAVPLVAIGVVALAVDVHVNGNQSIAASVYNAGAHAVNTAVAATTVAMDTASEYLTASSSEPPADGEPTDVVPADVAPAPGQLPEADGTGKVHSGKGARLPNASELGDYSPEDLESFVGELEKSVADRIRVTAAKGNKAGHGRRQGEEQQLIKQIRKHLEDK